VSDKNYKSAFIYKITNLINGKFYIGSTIRAKHIRKYEHFSSLRLGSHYNSYLQKSWNKYGEQSFKFEILEDFRFPIYYEQKYIGEYVVVREFYWVSLLNPEYNIRTDITIGNTGCHHSEETKNKIRIANTGKQIGRKHSKETREKMRNARIGHVVSEETRLKISESNKGKTFNHTEETKEKIRNSSLLPYRITISRENQKKMAKMKIGCEVSDNTKRKIAMTLSGKNRIIEIYREENIIGSCYTQQEASKLTGVKRSGISNNLVGLSNSAGKYIFKYKNL
jgi:group I intron endonuclease